MSLLAFILLYGVSYGLVLCLISIGLVITMGLMRVVNLAHGSFAAIGGYVAVSLMSNAGRPCRGAGVLCPSLCRVRARSSADDHWHQFRRGRWPYLVLRHRCLSN